MPCASSTLRTASRVVSRTSRWSDSNRLSAVNATTARSANVSCVHARSARAARICLDVIIQDHIPKPEVKRHRYDYFSRIMSADRIQSLAANGSIFFSATGRWARF